MLMITAASLLAIADLPSWNDGEARTRIIEFVQRVSDPSSPHFVPTGERIAVFDNDGTLWVEKPAYVQAHFVVDRVRATNPGLLSSDPDVAPDQALLDDLDTLAAAGEHKLAEFTLATHAGMTTEQFDRVAGEWLAGATHPNTGRLYTDMVYQPQLELLDYLRDHGFTTFIVSGGGIDFLRVFAEETYGVPPHQVLGSSIELAYDVVDGVPVIHRLPEIDFIDDKAGKPVAIERHIGQRPILACGNSDGDFEMLEWTTAGAGPRLGIIIHHDDVIREWAYDRDSKVGRLERGLDEAEDRGWLLVSMKDDWRSMFPPLDDERHGEEK